jgi:hypothetical protein
MATPNTADIALHLRQFIQAVEKKKNTEGIQTNYKPKTKLPKDRILEIYEVCLNGLKEEDRTRFDNILKEMTKALPKVK